MEIQTTPSVQGSKQITDGTLMDQCAQETGLWTHSISGVPIKPYNWFINRITNRKVSENMPHDPGNQEIESLVRLYTNGQNLNLRERLKNILEQAQFSDWKRPFLILLNSLNEAQLGSGNYRISEEDIPKVTTSSPSNEIRTCFQMCFQNARYYLFEKKDPIQVKSWVNQLYHLLGLIGAWDSSFLKSAQILTWYILTSAPTTEFTISNNLTDSIRDFASIGLAQNASPIDTLNLSIVFINLARHYQRLNDLSSSLEFCDSALKIDPQNGLLRLLKATIHARTGDLKMFQAEIQAALRSNVIEKSEIQATLCMEESADMLIELDRMLAQFLDRTSYHNLNNKQHFEVSKPMKNFLTLESPRIHQVTILEYAPQINFKAFTEADTLPFEYETNFLMSYITKIDRKNIVNSNSPWPPGDSIEYFSKQNENTRWIYECYQKRNKLSPQQKGLLSILLRTLGFEQEAGETIGVTEIDCLENTVMFNKPQSPEIFFDYIKLSMIAERVKNAPHVTIGSQFLDSVFTNIQQRYAQKNVRSLKSLILSSVELLKICFRTQLHSKSSEINRFLTEAIVEAGQSKKFNAFELAMMKLKHEFAFSHSTQLRGNTRLELLKETEKSLRLLETTNSLQFLTKKELLVEVIHSQYHCLLEMGRLSQATIALEEVCNLESVKNEFHYQLGLVYLTAGNVDEAKKVFLANLKGLASIRQRSTLALAEIFEIEKDQFRSSSLAM